jgi:hypothetical protein
MQYEAAKDWRELLGFITREPRFKQRILDELGIKPITLTRWIEGRSKPRQQNFQQLVTILPEFRENFYDLLGEELTEAAIAGSDDASRVIPTEFFARVLFERSHTQKSLRFWTLSNLIIQQALSQLDPDRLGMAITIVQCMKSSRSPFIRTLRETAACGTLPWQSNMEQKGMFLGAESLAGYCVNLCRGVENNDVRDRTNPLPAHQVPFELSAAASPILLSGKVAGCLLVSSTQPNFFISQFRLNLIHTYANLISLLFEPWEFYDASEIRLQALPLHDKQFGYFVNFRSRVIETMETHHISNVEAEQLVWEVLEEELLASVKQAEPIATES